MTCKKEKISVRKKVLKKYVPSGKSFGRLYFLMARKEYIEPDPLLFLHKYRKKEVREVVALIACSLAFGRVEAILASIEKVLRILSSLPGKDFAEVLKKNSPEELQKVFADFQYRFVNGSDMALFLAGAGRLLQLYGSLENAFLAGYDKKNDEDILPALENFGKNLCYYFPESKHFLFPVPSGKSACKRPFLMLRFLVRNRDVDTGTWKKIPPKKLLVPLDTHMFRMAKVLGFTSLKSAGLPAAKEITEKFASFDPEDPVKFDFPLTRFGINPAFRGKNIVEVLQELEEEEEQ